MLIPVGSKIATQRRRLAELAVARRRAIEFLAVLTVAAVLGTIATYLLHKTMGSLWTTMPVAMGLGLMALGYVAFSPLMHKSRAGMDRLFYRRRWEALQELNQFNARTENLTDLEKLSRSLIPLVQRAMDCSPVVLILPDRHNDSSWSATEVGSAAAPSSTIDWPAPWLKTITRHHDFCLAPEMFALSNWLAGPKNSRELIQEQDVDLFLPLKCGSELVGLLLLGPKATGRSFSTDEIELLKQVGASAAAAIEKALLYKEVRLQLEELKETQAQLLQSGRLASVGTLAAGVAHEVNNPNFAIAGMTELLLASPESHLKTPEALQYVTIISEMSDRIARVVQGMLVYSRNERTPALVDLNQVADSTLRLVAHRLDGRGIGVLKAYHPTPVTTRAVPNQLQQALMNLVLNAVDAMEPGQALTLSTGMAAGRTWFSCAVTGRGVSQENLDRIFDAFFTTKPAGKGTGLGLHITHKIIQDSGGEIEVQSQEGEGSTFTIYLPAADARAPDANEGAGLHQSAHPQQELEPSAAG
jgi:signal transduction histidine kinase